MTSVVPFAAIVSGKQKLPVNFLSEFLRPSYVAILVGSITAYYLHPFMQAGAALTHW
jgi:zeta-carotene isomerase